MVRAVFAVNQGMMTTHGHDRWFMDLLLYSAATKVHFDTVVVDKIVVKKKIGDCKSPE